MKFKVGDKVRFTREKLLEQARGLLAVTEELVGGVEIFSLENGWVFFEDFDGEIKTIPESHVELVPEQSQFEYGEMVEVYSPNKKKRRKRFFICEAHGARYPYICVDLASENSFKNGKKFQTNSWGRIRKLPHQLTRKEIANHFGVDENFILIDDINEDEIQSMR